MSPPYLCHSIQYDTIAVPLAPECCYEARTLSEVESTLEVYAAISFDMTTTDCNNRCDT